MLRLHVIDRESRCIGYTEARPGLKTTWGVVTRVSKKSVWARDGNGPEKLHRQQNGHLPSVYRSCVADAAFDPYV